MVPPYRLVSACVSIVASMVTHGRSADRGSRVAHEWCLRPSPAGGSRRAASPCWGEAKHPRARVTRLDVSAATMTAWSSPAEGQALHRGRAAAVRGRDGRIALTLVLAGNGDPRGKRLHAPPAEATSLNLAILVQRPRTSCRCWRRGRFPLLAAVAYHVLHRRAPRGSQCAAHGHGARRPRVPGRQPVARRGLGGASRFLPRSSSTRWRRSAAATQSPGALPRSSSSRRRSSSASRRESDRRRRPSSAPPRRRWPRACKEQTAMEERARIARELHDIVAHHLSVIAVQSETARPTSPKLSADARGRFEAIAQTARDALTETRRLLGVLREDVAGEGPGAAARSRPAGRAGRHSARHGCQRPSHPGGQGRAVTGGDRSRRLSDRPGGAHERRRDVPGADVDLEVSYGDGRGTLRIRDYGPGPADGELLPGHGLVGMRDRATVAGGTFSAGAADGRGFVVEATLPISGDPVRSARSSQTTRSSCAPDSRPCSTHSRTSPSSRAPRTAPRRSG